MRTFATLALTSAVLATSAHAEQTKEEKDASFLQGLDQGFFMRNELQGHRQFDCPDLVVDLERTKQLSEMMAPAKMMTSLLGQQNEAAEQIGNVMGGLEIFFEEVMAFQTLAHDYKGSDFCSGLLFGIHGSRMVIGIGKYMIEAWEQTSQMAAAGNKGKRK